MFLISSIRREYFVMTRAVLAFAVVCSLPVGVGAAETEIRLNVRPMAAPKPALKYLLLPEVRELSPGNPAQYYLRSFAEQRNFFFGKEATADRARYVTLPLAELPKEKLLDYGGSALRQADWAARLDTIDWQMLQRVQTDGMDLALPELGPLRVLATALQVRFRGDVADKRFDDAVRSAKTMFAFARHLGEHPTEAANRLGICVAEMAVASLEEMIQQPGCPNLYWAFSDLPSPLVELRKGMQGERSLVATDLGSIVGDAIMTEEQLEKVVSRLSGLIGFAREQSGQPPRNLRAELARRVKDSDRLVAARGRLTEEGSGGNLIRQFSPTQIIILDEKRDYDIRRDEGMKLLGMAPWQIDALTVNEKARNRGDGLFTDFLPNVVSAHRAQGRLEQRLAMLRHVEGLRLYAAGHDGKLPEKLADLTFPLPVDPFSGKSFVYEANGTVAKLRGCPPRGEEKNAACNVAYRVTIQK
jgi:hypothetical protein